MVSLCILACTLLPTCRIARVRKQKYRCPVIFESSSFMGQTYTKKVFAVHMKFTRHSVFDLAALPPWPRVSSSQRAEVWTQRPGDLELLGWGHVNGSAPEGGGTNWHCRESQLLPNSTSQSTVSPLPPFSLSWPEFWSGSVPPIKPYNLLKQ